MATKKRVFVSFDFDNDQALKEFILQQAKNPDSPFEVVNTSLKEAAPQATWLAEAEKRIRRSALVIVMVGLTTYKAPGVLKEVALARKHSVSTVQVIGYRGQLADARARRGAALQMELGQSQEDHRRRVTQL